MYTLSSVYTGEQMLRKQENDSEAFQLFICFGSCCSPNKVESHWFPLFRTFANSSHRENEKGGETLKRNKEGR